MKSLSWLLSIILTLVIGLGFSNNTSYAANLNNPQIMHIINRISFGPDSDDISTIKSQGIEAYLKAQLNPNTIPESSIVTQQLNQFDTLSKNPIALLQEYRIPGMNQINQLPPDQRQNAIREAIRKSQKVVRQLSEARLIRAISSNRQLQEVMVDFWFNHFNVFVNKGLTRVLISDYENRAIRPHVLGNFRDLLVATARHPAMQFYLDNWQNTDPNSIGARGRFKGLNENYARELMELHTLGVNGGYTQQDIITLAKIFTGWGFVRPNAPNNNSSNPDGFQFYPNRHDFSNKIFLNQSIKGSGVSEGEQALNILANHPATAKHISYKLAQYFVADQPPNSLVEKLTKKFQETNGDIKITLNTLFHSSEFLDPKYYNTKYKTPYQYIISVLRATNTQPRNHMLIIAALRQLGMPLYGCQTPNGYKNTQVAWLNPDGMLRRISIATAVSNGQFPGSSKINHQQLLQTIGHNLSPKTKQIIAKNPDQLKSALILGSPDFMNK